MNCSKMLDYCSLRAAHLKCTLHKIGCLDDFKVQHEIKTQAIYFHKYVCGLIMDDSSMHVIPNPKDCNLSFNTCNNLLHQFQTIFLCC